MSCQSDFNTARTFSARNRLGLPHDLRMVDSPMNEVNKLSANLMKLAFMLGTNTEGSPISHLEETSLLENITRMNFLFDNVRGRQMQQLPIMDVARPIRSVQELAALAPIPALAQPPVARLKVLRSSSGQRFHTQSAAALPPPLVQYCTTKTSSRRAQRRSCGPIPCRTGRRVGS